MATEKQLKNLQPKDLSKRPDHKAISRRGGQAKSPAKKLHSILNGLMMKKGLTDTQRLYLANIKAGNIDAVKDGLLGELLSDNLTKRDRMLVLDRAIRMTEKTSLSQTNVLVNVFMDDAKLEELGKRYGESLKMVKKEGDEE